LPSAISPDTLAEGADRLGLYDSRAMQSFVIEGGRPLSGTVRAAGNKNAALPVLAASVLASEEVRLTNVPRIRDVETMVELLADLGADIEWTGPNEVRVDGSGVEKTSLDPDLAREIRASFLLAGPLLSRFGRVTVPPPGGDVIGRRRLDTHVHAFTALGATFELNGAYELSSNGLRGTRMYLDEASVMGTENAIMAAVLAEGETILGNAACEPHIQDLCRFLGSLGAKIEGIGSNVLRIQGVDELGGGEHRIGPDHIEVASFVGLGAATGGEVLVEDVDPDDLISIVPAFRKLGIEMEITDSSVRGRPRRPDPEDRERDLAGLPRRPDLDRGHGRDAGAGGDPHLREDVREQALLR
jgi:UDP-N-acetylglucosamine 1-carboxyvinyltransferase